MTATTPDYSEYSEKPGGTDLELLTGLGLRLRELDRKKEEAQNKVKMIEAQMRDISWEQIPELMAKLGVRTFELADGSKITVTKKLRVSLPKKPERRQEVMDWLNDNGGEALIRRSFEITFGKSEEAWAAKFERDCKQRKKPLAIERLETIPVGTLKKFIGDKIEAGVDVPMATLGAHQQTIAEFKDAR